jgi:hypothetical protein
MYPHRSHILAPLTELTGLDLRAFHWAPEHHKAFDNMKVLIAQDVLFRYLDHNKAFHIYTDASDLQLGAVIMQGGMPVAVYSRKLNPVQRNYTTIEKERLSVVETIKNSVLCCSIATNCRSTRVIAISLSTLSILSAFSVEDSSIQPSAHCIKGELNVLADALSRLPLIERHIKDAPVYG